MKQPLAPCGQWSFTSWLQWHDVGLVITVLFLFYFEKFRASGCSLGLLSGVLAVLKLSVIKKAECDVLSLQYALSELSKAQSMEPPSVKFDRPSSLEVYELHINWQTNRLKIASIVGEVAMLGIGHEAQTDPFNQVIPKYQ